MAGDRDEDREDGVLTPDELDVSDDERVTELDENRFFVSLDDEEPSGPDAVDSRGASGADREASRRSPERDAPTGDDTEFEWGGVEASDRRSGRRERGDRAGDESPRGEATEQSARSRNPPPSRASPDDGSLTDLVADVPAEYAVAVAAKTDRGVAERRLASNNVVRTFEELLLWYAERVGDGETPPEDVLAILAAESELDL